MEDRIPKMETLKDGYELHVEVNRKNNGFKYVKSGMNVLWNYHEKGMTVHPSEVARMKSIEDVANLAVAKAKSKASLH